MSDRLKQLRSLADGVGDLQHGQPGDDDHCTAAELIRWAVTEVERHRMTEEERDDLIDAVHPDWDVVLYGYLARTAPQEKEATE